MEQVLLAPCQQSIRTAGGIMKSLFSSQVGLVGTVMNMQLQRQNVIAGNLSNIDTPQLQAA